MSENQDLKAKIRGLEGQLAKVTVTKDNKTDHDLVNFIYTADMISRVWGRSVDELASNPEFMQLIGQLRQNPEVLVEPFLEQLVRFTPELSTLIERHMDEFLRLIKEAPVPLPINQGKDDE